MSPNNRIELLDGWRALAVLSMLLYHLLWDLEQFFPACRGWAHNAGGELLQLFCGVSFVFIAGLSSALSRSNLRRSIPVLIGAAAVTGVSYAVGSPILFGVLHLLGCCMLLCGLWGKKLQTLPTVPAVGVCLLLFAAGYIFKENVRVEVPGLFWLGLRPASFRSADYYPLIPWLFLFTAGYLSAPHLLPRLREADRSLPAPLLWMGRRAFWIYLLHQPLLYGGCYLLSRLI